MALKKSETFYQVRVKVVCRSVLGEVAHPKTRSTFDKNIPTNAANVWRKFF
jgi:hypothetical protein